MIDSDGGERERVSQSDMTTKFTSFKMNKFAIQNDFSH